MAKKIQHSVSKVFNILHVISTLPVGGVENMLFKVVQGYDKNRFQVSVCCIKEGGGIADMLRGHGYSVKVLNKMRGHGFDWGAPIALYKLLKSENIHILRTHQYHANMYGRIAGIFARVPVIIPSIHNIYDSPNKPKLHRRIINYLLGFFSDALVAVSKAVAADIVAYDRIKPEKIKVIHNGVAIEDFNETQSKNEAKKLWGLPLDAVIVGSVGRLTVQKGHRYLIDAITKLKKIRVVIAGEGPLMQELKGHIHNNKAQCTLIGKVSPEKIPSFLRALDVFCFPSLWEGFGTTLVEAMATGLPIVASDIAPHREVVGDAGILIPPENTEILTEKLEILINDPFMKDILGKKAKERAARFSIENTMKVYEGLFEEILRKKGFCESI